MVRSTAAVRLLAGDKEPVRLASTANLALAGLLTVDGVVTEAGDRVLVKDQSDATENGIYTASAGTWYRAPDFATSRAMIAATKIAVQAGTQAGDVWSLDTNRPDIGDDDIEFSLYLNTSIADDINAAREALVAEMDAIIATALAAGKATQPEAEAGVSNVGWMTPLRTKQAIAVQVGVSVMHFGAVGDGVTNDSAAIQAAIDAVGTGGEVIFPALDFNLVTGVTINHDGVYLRGAGPRATRLIFSPTANGTLISVTKGASLGVSGGIKNLSLYSSDATYTKVGINISDFDVYEVHSVDINGSGGWHGASSIGIKTNGRDLHSFRDITIVADNPIYMGTNPNSVISADHYNFHNLYMIGTSATLPLIDVQTGANLTNISFDGYQAWVQGAGGLRWIDTTTVAASQSLSFSNVRLEQSLDPTKYAFDIQHNTGVQMLSFNNINIGDRQGWKLRKALNTTISGSVYAVATGVAIDADSTNSSLEWMNTFFQAGATGTLTGLYKQDGKPSNIGNALPYSARYLNTLATNELGVPLSSFPLTLANNATAAIPGTTGFTICALIVATSTGVTGIFMLNGTNHNTNEASDPTSQFSSTAGTASSTNIYWSAGNARYEIENKNGGSVNYTFALLGRAG